MTNSPASSARPFLVYRDRVGVASEVSFLRRQYLGFTRLRPVWTGRVLLPSAHRVGASTVRLGGEGPLGALRRLLFRHLQWAPPPLTPTELPDLAPILHAQFARGGALALPLARALGLRMVVTLHGGDVSKHKNWSGTMLARRWPALLAYASQFVCVSSAVAEVAARRGVPPNQLLVLPIGVEVPDHPPKAVAPPAHVPPAHVPTAHVFVGRFVEKKGIVVLADAVRHLRAAGDTTPVVCVGDGKLRPVLEALARDVTGVTLTGWLDPAEVGKRMAAAWSLLVPSVVAEDGDAEGLPSVVPEAMAQACPVIGSDQGGIAEAVQNDRTGLLVPAGNAQALAAAMHRISHEPMLRPTLGSASFTAVATTLNAHIQSRKLETLLLGHL